MNRHLRSILSLPYSILFQSICVSLRATRRHGTAVALESAKEQTRRPQVPLEQNADERESKRGDGVSEVSESMVCHHCWDGLIMHQDWLKDMRKKREGR